MAKCVSILPLFLFLFPCLFNIAASCSFVYYKSFIALLLWFRQNSVVKIDQKTTFWGVRWIKKESRVLFCIRLAWKKNTLFFSIFCCRRNDYVFILGAEKNHGTVSCNTIHKQQTNYLPDTMTSCSPDHILPRQTIVRCMQIYFKMW